MAIRLDENPFDLVKASDFSAAEILDYWVDIADDHGGLVNFLQPRLLMPMILVGGKGSGKT
ncbi:ORC-CDC6 family AAA ATPase, partial [Agrobacterium tumefaciens]